ncbi:MAG: hypothetical protein SGCHY_001549 [Lobulomycetales sp.]
MSAWGLRADVLPNYGRRASSISPVAESPRRPKTRDVGRKTWNFWFDEDLDLFDSIAAFRRNGGTKGEAVEKFLGESHSADSLIGIAYDIEKIDYVIQYPKELPPNDEWCVEDREKERADFLEEMLRQGIYYTIDEADDTHCYACLVTPFHALCSMAETQNVRMVLKKVINPITSELLDGTEPAKYQKRFGFRDKIDLNHLSVPFRVEELGLYRESSDKEHFFRPFLRAYLTKRIIDSTKVEYKRLYGIAEMIEIGSVTSYFHLHREGTTETDLSLDIVSVHDTKEALNLGVPIDWEIENAKEEKRYTRSYLQNMWLKRYSRQPISAIREYLGEKTTIYFAFAGLYTNWLIFPAAAGTVVVIYGFIRLGMSQEPVSSKNWHRVYDNTLMPVYAIFISLWITAFLEFWKRRDAYLQLKWGLLDNEQAEPVRRKFTPTTTTPSYITGTVVPHFPGHTRLLRQSVTILAILAMLCLVVLTIFIQVIFQEQFLAGGENFGTNSLVLTISGYLFTKGLIALFKPIADRLSEWENYDLESLHLDARNFKFWSFIFVNVISRLSYLSFVRPFLSARGIHMCGPQSPDPASLDSHAFTCSSDLFFQVLILILADIIIIRALELIVPQLSKKKKKSKEAHADKKRVSPESTGPQLLVDNEKSIFHNDNWDQTHKILVENAELPDSEYEVESDILQKIDQIRSDAYKYLFLYRRAEPERAKDLGSWFKILRLLSILSISTNSLLVAFISQSFEDTYLAYVPKENWLIVRLVVVIGWHIIVNIINVCLAYAIRDIPKFVQIARTREVIMERYVLANKHGDSHEDLTKLDPIFF